MSHLAAVFVRGLQFGTPSTALALLVDTGSSISHIVGAGCGSSCGADLPDSLGYNASASRTARPLLCDDACAGCAICRCAQLPGGQQYCAYNYSYGRAALAGLADMFPCLQADCLIGSRALPSHPPER